MSYFYTSPTTPRTLLGNKSSRSISAWGHKLYITICRMNSKRPWRPFFAKAATPPTACFDQGRAARHQRSPRPCLQGQTDTDIGRTAFKEIRPTPYDTRTHKTQIRAEDERTALIFGPLLYLPANTLWQILRSSCFDNESMPQKGGELLHYEFWPNYNKTEHTSNESYVEPDLLLEFEYFNLLVEIKRKDVQSYRQYEGQWKNEIQAFVNGQTHGENKPLLLIALGGNTSPEAFHTPLGRITNLLGTAS